MFAIGYLKDGVYKEKEFYNKTEANAAFVKLNKLRLPIVTRKEWDEIKYWNGTIEMFVKPIICDTGVYTDMMACDIVANFVQQHLDNTTNCDEDDTFSFQIENERYVIETGDVRMDEQMADLYDMPDKYGYWQIYKGKKELIELRWSH